jgi:hypothetical protein
MGAAVNELESTLRELEDLLRRCGERAPADWVAQRRASVAAGGPEAAAARRDVRGVLAGMGSLSDISLQPRPDSGLSIAEVERRRADLLRRLSGLTSDEPRLPPRMIPVGSSNADLPPRDP